MFARACGLCGAFAAAAALMSASSAAVANGDSRAAIDVSTRAAVVHYLRSLHIDPRGVVIERGVRNYAGGNCPGRGWTCTTTVHPVVQVAAAGGSNTFRCSTASCAVVQISNPQDSGTNTATCIKTHGLTQKCTIRQTSTTANNKAVVYETLSKSTGLTQVATSTVSITQKGTGPATSNEACVYQAIALAGSATSNTRVILTQSAHQRVTIKQDSANGGNSAAESATSQGECTGNSITQRQTLDSYLIGLKVVSQKQNAADKGADVTIDVEQNQSPGFVHKATGQNSANFDQYNSLTAVANSPAGPVRQTQSNVDGGLLGTINQDSTGISTAAATQTDVQCVKAAKSGSTSCQTSAGELRPSSVTQRQAAVVHKGVGIAKQTGNAADTFVVNQSSTQDNTPGPHSHQSNTVQGDCRTAGNCTINQTTDSNGQQHSNTQSGKDLDSTTQCTSNHCKSADSGLSTEAFEAGAPGWTTTGMWHIQDHPQDVSVVSGINPELVTLPDAGSLPAAHGGTHDAWFGDPATGTYCGTDWNSVPGQSPKDGCTSSGEHEGDLTSPPFSFHNAASVVVSFWTWYEIEGFHPAGSDLMTVLYSTDGGSTWDQADFLNPLSDPLSSTQDQSYTNNGLEQAPTWGHQEVNLGLSGSGNVLVRFEFDTGDDLQNGFRGWAIDDVAVSTS